MSCFVVHSSALGLKKEKRKKKIVLFYSLRTSDPFLLLKSPRLLINLPRNWLSQFLGQEDLLVEEMASQSNPLSCLENPMDRGAWWATVHRVSKSQTLSQFLGRLINPESPRRREWSGALEEGIEVLSSQGGEKNKFCFFFKPRADDCTTK